MSVVFTILSFSRTALFTLNISDTSKKETAGFLYPQWAPPLICPQALLEAPRAVNCQCIYYSKHSLQQGVGILTTAMAAGTGQVNERNKPEQSKTQTKQKWNKSRGFTRPATATVKSPEVFGKAEWRCRARLCCKTAAKPSYLHTTPYNYFYSRKHQWGNQGACSIEILQLVTWAECTWVNLPSKKQKQTQKTPKHTIQQIFQQHLYQYCKNWTINKTRFKPHLPTFR